MLVDMLDPSGQAVYDKQLRFALHPRVPLLNCAQRCAFANGIYLTLCTRARNSFNMERMVIHTVKTVKGWDDPVYALSSASAIDLSDAVHDDVAKDKETGKTWILHSTSGFRRGNMPRK